LKKNNLSFLADPTVAARDERPDDAAACLKRKLDRRPDDIQTLLELARIYQRQGQFEEAAACLARALARRPNDAAIHNDLGDALSRLSRHEEAEICFRRALAAREDFVEALNNLGHAARMQGRLAEAVVWHRRAIARDPNFAEAQFHLGVTMREQGRLAEAVACHRRALALTPDFANAWVHLGAVLREGGHFAEAAACQRRALALAPGNLDAQLNLAFIHLTLGDLPAGSIAYECRFGTGTNRRYPVEGRPMWDRRPLPNRTLLLFGELGFGDAIQFVRYATMARALAGRVVLRCHPALQHLLATAPGIDEVSPITSPMPDCDAFIPLLSLMRLHGTTLENIPAPVPYLAADPARLAPLAPRLAGHDLKVGIVWAGNPGQGNDRRRSLPLAALSPLFEVRGVKFFSLQMSAFIGRPSARAAELRASPWSGRIADLAPHLRDFADTAAALSCLDLLISVDTSVLHLAGALGRPAWALLAFNADWRWFRARADCPWYPSLRLYRQDRRFDWTSVVEQVRRDLSALVQGPRGRSEGS
jgi:tetratricopeptide (TPR) repeat protein